MLKASVTPYTLRFAFTARTSRETFTTKQTYFLDVFDTANPTCRGRGEVAVFPSLQPSFTDWQSFEALLNHVAAHINEYVSGAVELPCNSAIRFAVETAVADLHNGGCGLVAPGEQLQNIAEGVPINGLVWMDSPEKMEAQIAEKIRAGFRCIKLKIGALDFDRELELIRSVRNTFNARQIELRVDANGAFTAENVMARLDALATLDLHSIEQPLPRDHAMMAQVCRQSPIPVALDEDMIERWWTAEQKHDWLKKHLPHYIVLKPSLVGGFCQADEWIRVARDLGVGWWCTSALESNVGLSAIAQWLSGHPENLNIAHGLGTGQIYTNNLSGRTRLVGDKIFVEV